MKDHVAPPQPLPSPVRGRRRALLRACGAILLPLALLGLGRALGLHHHLTVDGVRELVATAGAWGAALFLAAFCVGELVHVPGLVFVGAAALFYGPFLGGAISYAGALLSISVSFAVVRGIGGKALGEIEKPWVRRWMARLDARPVRTIAVLRLVLVLSPPLNYALALSPVRFRDYLLGSALGLLPPTALAIVFFDRVVAWAR